MALRDGFLLSETWCRNLSIFFHRDEIKSHNYTCSLHNWVHKVYPNPKEIIIDGQKHNLTMVSNASPGTATPKMNGSFVHMWLMFLLTVHAHRMGTWNVPIRPLLTEIWVLQWLVFGWFWGWRTSDTRSARQNLGKKNTPQSWRPLLPSGCHGALPPALPHTAISQHVVQPVCH